MLRVDLKGRVSRGGGGGGEMGVKVKVPLKTQYDLPWQF